MKSLSDAPDPATLPESIRQLQSIWKLSAALERTSREMQRTLGVSGRQRFLLRFVGLLPGIRREQLADALAVAAADLQADLEDLVGRHLLTDHQGAPGYYLTAQGAGVNAVMAGTIEHAVSNACDEALPSERTAFRRMLDRVIANLPPTRCQT